jgi:hypothetical protein
VAGIDLARVIRYRERCVRAAWRERAAMPSRRFLPGLLLLIPALLGAQNAAEPPVKLAEVVVTPSRFGVADIATTAVAALTAEQLELLPQVGDDLFRSIARLPGLATDDISAQFWVRGAPQSEE